MKGVSLALSCNLLIRSHNGLWAAAVERHGHAEKRNEQMAALRERDEGWGTEDTDRKALAPGEAAHQLTKAQEG